MSTYQPPGGQPPEGTPAYAQPQDPWAAGQDHGLASVPTDPIPQQYDPYAHGIASEQWSQETVAHGGQSYGYGPPPPQRRTGLIIAVFVTVLVLGGGGGFAAWYLITQRNLPDPQPTATTEGTPATTNPSIAASFDPHKLKVGECIVNKGTLADPIVEYSPCVKGSFKVIKALEGPTIRENAEGKFDADTTSTAACAGTGFESWYGFKHPSDDSKDAFFCLTNN